MATLMDSPAKSSSFTPIIRCSNCTAEIEISRIGDHICSQTVPVRESRFQHFQGSFPPITSRSSNASSIFTARSRQSSRINLPAANPQFQSSNQLPARGTINSIPKKIATSPADGRQSFKFPSQSVASSHANHPASNDSISQDSAFPPFPTSKSRSTTPTIPSDITQSFASYNLDYQNQRDSNSSFAPLSPRDNGGGSVLQRMNSIVPGPFNLSSGNAQPSGHKKTATMGSSKDFIYQPIAEAGKRNVARPSTAGSINSRKPSLSSISGGPRSTVSRGRPDTPDEILHQGHFHTVEIIDGESVMKTAQEETRIEALRREDRSHTYPLDFPDQTRGEQSRPEALRRPSAPSLHVTRPSVAAAIRPLHEIGSVSSFKPSRPIRERGRSPVKATTGEPSSRTKIGDELLAGTKPKQASTLPASIYAESYAVGNPHHTPSKSISSNDSSGSDGRSGSSNSTPPLSGSPQKQKRRPSNLSQGGSLMQEFEFGLEDKLDPSLSLDSSTNLAATDPSMTTKAGTLAPGSMNDPAIHSGRPSPVTTPDGSFDPFPLESGELLHSPAPPSPQTPSSSPRKPTKANKGRCRGCGELIIGKSVSSADGRLTGRYHKRCFVCQRCRAPFRTADFYILENDPYCSRHYHQLNHSICTHCDKGIEGPYLETDPQRKFHPACFKCQDCHTILQHDYFEVGGSTYCELHAQQPSSSIGSGGGGTGGAGGGAGGGDDGGNRRDPERRTTRLMMMV